MEPQFCLYSYLICSKVDLDVAKYSDFPDSNKISNKTFPLLFISLKSVRHHAVLMYICSNVEIIIRNTQCSVMRFRCR